MRITSIYLSLIIHSCYLFLLSTLYLKQVFLFAAFIMSALWMYLIATEILCLLRVRLSQ